MKKLLGFLYAMALTFIMAGPAFARYSRWWDGGGCTPPHSVPEPTTMLLIGSGLVGLAVFARKKSKK